VGPVLPLSPIPSVSRTTRRGIFTSMSRLFLANAYLIATTGEPANLVNVGRSFPSVLHRYFTQYGNPKYWYIPAGRNVLGSGTGILGGRAALGGRPNVISLACFFKYLVLNPCSRRVIGIIVSHGFLITPWLFEGWLACSMTLSFIRRCWPPCSGRYLANSASGLGNGSM